MKELLKIQGGYPRQIDYLFNLQQELFTMNNSLFAGLGIDLALSGCNVTDHGNGTIDIAPGVVYIGGEVLRFDGISNFGEYTSKTLARGAFVSTDPKIFADQQAKNVYREAKAVIADKSSVLQISIKNTNLYNLQDYIRDNIASADVRGAVRHIYDLDGNFADNFDGTGLGISARWLGWALMNGNNGTKDACGRTMIGIGRFYDPVTGIETNYSRGDQGGEKTHRLTIAEMPNHAHTYNPGDYAGRSDNANDRDVMLPGSSTRTTASVGGDAAHNNMQPYIAIYFVVKIS
jgi:hypothetical protein